MVPASWTKARSAYRQGEEVFVKTVDNKLHQMELYTYKDMWGYMQSYRSAHAFLYQSRITRKELGLRKLKYFVLEPVNVPYNTDKES